MSAIKSKAVLGMALAAMAVAGVVWIDKPDAAAPSSVWAAPAPVMAPKKTAEPSLEPAQFTAVNRAELAFIAKVRTMQLTPVMVTGSPQRFTAFITFEKATMLRGADPEQATFSFLMTEKPTIAVGTEVIAIGYSRPRPRGLVGNGRLYHLEATFPATEVERRGIAEPLALPIGWSHEDGKLLSPWARLNGPKWTVDARADSACSKTGRPALLAGAGIQLTTEKVLAKQQFGPALGKQNGGGAAKGPLLNGDGDGDVKLTVVNTGKQAAQVPALLATDKGIDWASSVVVLSAGIQGTNPWTEWKLHVARAAGAKALKPVTLNPGESVSGVVNILRLQGELPVVKTGAQMLTFRICLGELSSTETFGYTNAYHDKIAGQK
jgi:hypothetical protein